MLVIVAKGFSELPNLHMLLKQKSPSLPINLALETFGELLIMFSAKLFAKNFSKSSYLDDSGISLPVFSSRTNLKLHNIPITPKMVKKVIMNLD